MGLISDFSGRAAVIRPTPFCHVSRSRLSDRETLGGDVRLVGDVTHCFLSVLGSFLDYGRRRNPLGVTVTPPSNPRPSPHTLV